MFVPVLLIIVGCGLVFGSIMYSNLAIGCEDKDAVVWRKSIAKAVQFSTIGISTLLLAILVRILAS